MTPDQAVEELTRLRSYLASRFSASVRATSTVDVTMALLEHLWRIEQMQVVALRTHYIAEQATQCPTNTVAFHPDAGEHSAMSPAGEHPQLMRLTLFAYE